MSKRKLDKIDGRDPWDIEVAYLVEHLKVEPIDARAIVVISWMYRGDLRPLSAEIKKKGTAIMAQYSDLWRASSTRAY
jgi:hypothetical protein